MLRRFNAQFLMTQFDAYKNRNDSTRKTYPLLLNVQHPVLDSLSTSIIVPLARTGKNSAISMDTVAPIVLFDEEPFVLIVPQMSAVLVQSRQESIGTLAFFRAEIVAVLDFAFTGY